MHRKNGKGFICVILSTQENESEMATFYESTFRSEMYRREVQKHCAQPNGPLAAADTYALRGQK